MSKFLKYLFNFYNKLLDVRFEDIKNIVGGSNKIAILVVDMINGFCYTGPLASKRVQKQ